MALRFRSRSSSDSDEKGRSVGDDGLVTMTIWEHIAEFRTRLIRSVLAIAAGAVFGWFIYDRILGWIDRPYCKLKMKEAKGSADILAGACKFVITDATTGIKTRLTVSAYVGLFLALPIVLWQVWRFIAAGLHPREKKYALPFIFCSIGLFGLGALVAIVTFPQALSFLIHISGSHVDTLFAPDKYIQLYTLIIVAFGLSFEFPVVLVFLQLVRIVTPKKLMSWWRYAIVGIFVFAAVITPSQDPYSLFGMALPMIFFYFVAAGIGKLLGR